MKKTILISVISFCFLSFVFAQESDTSKLTFKVRKKDNSGIEQDEVEIFQIMETMPSFPGGLKKQEKYFTENIKYPKDAKEQGITGTVYVTFVVETDGSITGVRILRGIGNSCDEEAMRVVRSMPRWNPGERRKKPVRIQFNMPIRFNLK